MAVRYIAYDWMGQKVQGVLEGVDSEEEAYQRLREQDLIPYRLKRIRPRPSPIRFLLRLMRVGEEPVLELTRQLVTLLQAGIPVYRALQAQIAQTRNPVLRRALQQIVRRLEEGGRLSDAFAEHPNVFPGFYLRLLKVAEATGNLVSTLHELAETLERRRQVRERIRNALTYPAITLLVAVFAGYFLVTYSLPRILDLLRGFGGELPLVTRMLMRMAEVSRTYGLYGVGTLGALLVLAGLYRRTPRGAFLWDRLMLALPAVGRLVRVSNLYTLVTTFQTLVEAGVAPAESLQLAGESVGNRVVRARVERVVRLVQEGRPLAHAFGQDPFFPELLVQGIRTAEVTGTLAQSLRILADHFEQETLRSLTGLTEFIQPVVLFVVGGFIAFVAAAVLAGIYNSMGAIGQV